MRNVAVRRLFSVFWRPHAHAALSYESARTAKQPQVRAQHPTT
jgi:hypothetical protein